MPYDVFISYVSSDIKYAENLHNHLVQEGFKIWLDKARLKPGFNWHQEIEQGCENSRVILPVLTPKWKNSDWTKYETYGAEAVFPILFEGEWADVSTPPLERFQAEILNMKKSGGPDWSRLFEDIRRVRDKPLPEKTVNLTHIHYRANEYFTGREKELIQIHEELHCSPKVAFTQGRVRAIIAMGGAGKTTLVRQYAEKFWRCYPQIFWIDCRNGLEQEFAEMHDYLFPERINIGLENKDKAASALHKLNNQETRLLILDNAEDENSIMDWIPKSGSCHTLITSRNTDWSAAIKPIQLDILNEKDSIEFLQKRSNIIPKGEELKTCKSLALKLGGLPLALEQAAAYIEQQGKGFGFTDYLQLYEQATLDLLAVGTLGSTEYRDPVTTTWKTTIERLSPSTRAILQLCSFFSSTPIRIKTLINGGNVLIEYINNFDPENSFNKPNNIEFWIRNEIKYLKAYSMIRIEEQAFSLHPLLLTIQFMNQSEMDKLRGWETVTKLLESATLISCWKEDCHHQWTLENYRRWEQFFPHIKRLYKLSEKIPGIESTPSFSLLVINAYATMDKYSEAIDVCIKLIKMLSDNTPPHPFYYEAKDSLAYLLMQAGFYKYALYAFDELHKLRIELAGEDSLDTLRAYHNVALARKRLGDPKGAEPIMRKVLEKRKQLLGKKHYDTLTSTQDLGFILMDIEDKLDEAEILILQAMDYCKTNLGDVNPDTQAVAGNLVFLYNKKGDFHKVESYQKELLKSKKLMFGNNHLEYYGSLHNLAIYIYKNGRTIEACEKITEVVNGYRQFLPPDNNKVLSALQDFLEMIKNLESYEEAIPFLNEIITKYEKIHGYITSSILRFLIEGLEQVNWLEKAKPMFLDFIHNYLKKDNANPAELRQYSLVCLKLLDFKFGEYLLLKLIKMEYEIPGTYCHLSRICILTDRLPKAQLHIERAWENKVDAKLYVIARILWFKITLTFINTSSSENFIDQLKAVLQKDDVYMEWTMKPVLDHIKSKITEYEHAFLSALVAAMSNKANLDKLNDFEEWKNAKPKEIE